MHSFIKFLLGFFFCFIFISTVDAQNKYPFNRDRSIKVGNRFKTSKQVSLYFQVQSTATNKRRGGHGSYDRILGLSYYSFELADHRGELAFYNGKTWYDLGIDIREKKKDIFLIFDEGKVSIYDGDQLVTTKQHARNRFNGRNLFFGSNFYSKEKFKGEIDFIMIHNRVLKREEITTISKGNIQEMIKTSPGLFYNFIDGKTYEKATNYRPFNIRSDYGLENKNNFAPMADDVEPKKRQNNVVEEVETIADELPPEVFISEPRDENNFEIKFTKIDMNDLEYKGKIIYNQKIIEPGNYDLIVKPDGTVVIKIKVIEDK